MESSAPHPGSAGLLDGAAAVVRSERAAGSHAALAGEGAGAAARAGALWRGGGEDPGAAGEHAAARCLEAADEPAALAAAAGMSEAGLRATAFVSGAGLVGAHGMLYGMAGKHLPLVVHVAAQAAARAGWTTLAGHDTVHAVADAGWFQLFAWDAQSAADLALIARRLAEQALVPGLLAQDAWLTTHRAAGLRVPERALAEDYLGAPEGEVACPTPAQRLLYGERRPRVPPLWNVDAPLLSGAAHGEGSLAAALAAQVPYSLAHVEGLALAAMSEYAALSGRVYAPLEAYGCEDAKILIVALGSAVPTARAVADHLRAARRLRVGVVSPVLLRPFPGAALAGLLVGRRTVLVLERAPQGLAEDPPLLTEVRAALSRAAENGRTRQGEAPHAGYPRARRVEELPALVSAAYGLGGRELDAADLLATLESLAGDGVRQPRRVLGTALLPRSGLTPKQEIFAQQLADAYPALSGAELPARAADVVRLLPEGARVVRVFAPHGREPFTLDDHLGRALRELSELHVQAWPTAGAPRRGSLTAFTVIAAHEPLPALDEPRAADVTVVSDTALLGDPAVVAALKPGGVLLLALPADGQAPAEGTPAPALPAPLLAAVQAQGVRVLGLPAHALAQEAARDAEAQRAALGTLLQGALLACPPVAGLIGLEGSALARELKSMLLRRHPHTEAVELEAQLALLRRGSEALRTLALPEGTDLAAIAAAAQVGPGASPELRGLPPHAVPLYDLHRHAEAHPPTRGAALPAADPFVGAGVLPAATGLLRDLSAGRAVYPHWLPERCTGCGACWALCPDAALPGLVNTPAELLEAGVRTLEAQGQSTGHLPRAVRVLEGKWRERLLAAGPGCSVGDALTQAVADTLPAAKATPDERAGLAAELEQLGAAVRPFGLAATAPFFAEPEAAARGSGGLLSVTLDGERCKACGACVQACPEQALELRAQTADALSHARRNWSFWLRLPTSGEAFRVLGEARSEAPTLETLLLDKHAYRTLVGGSDADPGAAGNTALHLLAALAHATVQPLVAAHVERLSALASQLEGHIRLRLAVDVSDVDALGRAVHAAGQGELTLADLSSRLDRDRTPIDRAWLARVTGTLAGLQRLRQAYVQGQSGRPRSTLGMVAALETGTAALATYPFNPFTFPLSGHPAQAAPGALAGVAEGHLARMAEGFRLVRMAELEVAGKYNPEQHDAFFAGFGWRDFAAEEWALCPPVVLLGDDAALAGGGAGAVLELLRSAQPVKVLCLDGHVQRALAHEPGTLPAAGEAEPGKEGAGLAGGALAGELALQAIAAGTAYVEQGSLGDLPRLLEGLRRGLRSPRPALFCVFRASLPPHGRADGLAARQSLLALQSRAHPALRFDPDAGAALHERLSLAGNPAPAEQWPVLAQERLDGAGHAERHEGPLTFAHFALAVPELAHHFQALAPDAPEDGVTPLAEYLEQDADERRETRPIVQAVDYAGRLGRWLVSRALVRATEQRRDLWRLLRALTREDIVPVDEAAIAEQARGEVLETVLRNLVELAQGNGQAGNAVAEALAAAARPVAAAAPAAGGAGHV